MKTFMTLSAATLLATGTAAFAGGMAEPVMTPAPTVVAAPVAVAPMSADWSGFYAGASLGYGQVSASDNLFNGEEPDGALYGLHAGYNYDFGRFVLGGELEYQGTDIQDDASGIDLDAVARAKVRAGYDAGNFMPYLTAGYAQAYTGGALDADDGGAFYGVGVDYQFGQNFVIGAEVLQHQFDDFDGTGVDLDATTASLRVSYKF